MNGLPLVHTHQSPTKSEQSRPSTNGDEIPKECKLEGTQLPLGPETRVMDQILRYECLTPTVLTVEARAMCMCCDVRSKTS